MWVTDVDGQACDRRLISMQHGGLTLPAKSGESGGYPTYLRELGKAIPLRHIEQLLNNIHSKAE